MRLYSPYTNLNLFVLLFLSVISMASYASDQPQGRILLIVSGAIDAATPEKELVFDLAMLGTLPQYSIATHTPWAKGLHTYQGFSAVDLLQRLGSSGTLLQITALNEYMTEIPLSDFVDNGAIFATHQDGKPMSIRNLGPIMVIYPFDEHEKLKSELFYGRSIWQVNRVKIMMITE
ncbi:molybdopterin-dependent oxidoreductase [Marinomonas sp.]|uniref:molybdopterin-dependent oxidoreductase n=1 Tax=Marinomonas sp. TaxID=1904862 RepID=UPI003BA88C72